jgi:hypothetical protein
LFTVSLEPISFIFSARVDGMTGRLEHQETSKGSSIAFVMGTLSGVGNVVEDSLVRTGAVGIGTVRTGTVGMGMAMDPSAETVDDSSGMGCIAGCKGVVGMSELKDPGSKTEERVDGRKPRAFPPVVST